MHYRKTALEQADAKAKELKSRLYFLVAGSARRFLSTVCRNYESYRHSNEKGAQMGIERHIDTFDRLVDEASNIKRTFGVESPCPFDDIVSKVVKDARTVARWLAEVKEVAAAKPAMVMVRFVSETLQFQM